MRFASMTFRAAGVVTAIGVLSSGAVAAAQAGTPAAQPMKPPPIAASKLPAPKDSSPTANVNPLAIACGAPGHCVAVGLYVGSSGSDQGLIETWSGGVWKAQRAPLPPDAASAPQAILFGVACSGPGSCAAIGSYTTKTAPFSSGLLLSLSNGVWKATAATAPGGHGAPANTYTGVGCNAPGSCTAVGNYNGTDGKKRGLIAFFHSRWKTITAPLPQDHVDPASGDLLLAELNGVSCSSKLCIGVGTYETSSNQYLPLAEAITPSSATANSTQAPLPSDAAVGSGFASLGRISCSRAGPCAAHGQYTDQSSITHTLLEPLGGAGWAPRSAPQAPTQNSNPATLSAISCPAATACVVAGLYTDTSNQPQPLFEVLAGNKWAAKKPPTALVMNAVACGSASFCAAAATSSSIANSLDVLSAGKWYPETPSVPGAAGAIPTLYAVACDAASSCLAVGAWGTLTGVVEHITGSADTTPPAVKLTSPTARFTLGSTTAVSWSASDVGSGVARIQVRWRSARWNSGWTAWSYPGPWQSLSPGTTHLSATGLVLGRDYCYSARARDHAGNWSAWTGQLCVARPLDDRAVSADTHWTRVSNKVYWNSTATVTKAHLARMRRTGAAVDRIAVIATQCPTCGTVGVYVGTTLVGKINLRRPATHHRSILTIPAFSYRTGTITLKVLTSGKSVQIDGLGIART